MKAIQTKYIGPTDTKGARIKATSLNDTLTIPYNHGFDDRQNHRSAAAALAIKIYGTVTSKTMVSGELKDSWVHIISEKK